MHMQLVQSSPSWGDRTLLCAASLIAAITPFELCYAGYYFEDHIFLLGDQTQYHPRLQQYHCCGPYGLASKTAAGAGASNSRCRVSFTTHQTLWQQ